MLQPAGVGSKMATIHRAELRYYGDFQNFVLEFSNGWLQWHLICTYFNHVLHMDSYICFPLHVAMGYQPPKLLYPVEITQWENQTMTTREAWRVTPGNQFQIDRTTIHSMTMHSMDTSRYLICIPFGAFMFSDTSGPSIGQDLQL